MTSTAIRTPRAVRRFTLGQFLYDVGFWVEYTLVRIRRSTASAAGYAAESLENLLLLVLRPLVQGLLADFAEDPVQLWQSNIFGKSLHQLVNEGLQNKLLHIPQEARTQLQGTLERVINEGCTGLICILI